ncbi:hypothetical protein BVG19_g2460 [[Candida] boidinii]|nr:hypothetical protein BVG19_g2460 [[Candida] boidinii]OWB52896.1 NAD+ kinase activity protein [[Candida] boidinii]
MSPSPNTSLHSSSVAIDSLLPSDDSMMMRTDSEIPKQPMIHNSLYCESNPRDSFSVIDYHDSRQQNHNNDTSERYSPVSSKPKSPLVKAYGNSNSNNNNNSATGRRNLGLSTNSSSSSIGLTMTPSTKFGEKEECKLTQNLKQLNNHMRSNSNENQRLINTNNNTSITNNKPSLKEKKNEDFIDKIENSSNLQSVKSHAQLAKTAHGVRILAKNLNKTTIHLNLESILIITKARDNSLVYLTRELAEWLLVNNNTIKVYVDHHLEKSQRFNIANLINDVPSAKGRIKFWTKNLIRDHVDLFDFVITLGGDGTVLYTSTLFQRIVPPVMSFALGSLGFLTNFQFEHFRSVLTNAFQNGVHTNLRMRFTCRVHKPKGELICEQQVLNELTVDRGPSPWVSMLELYGDGSLLTVAQADGLIIATPTGSTAYSLSAGGSLVHPSVSAISVTPICPHTLSFRPILLPDSMILKVKVPQRSRATAWASFDGRSRVELLKGYYVTVSASPFPFPSVKSSKTEYFDSVSRVLNWNSREEQKSFVHLLSDKNRKSLASYQKIHGENSPAGDYEFAESNSNGSSRHNSNDGINSGNGDNSNMAMNSSIDPSNSSSSLNNVLNMTSNGSGSGSGSGSTNTISKNNFTAKPTQQNVSFNVSSKDEIDPEDAIPETNISTPMDKDNTLCDEYGSRGGRRRKSNYTAKDDVIASFLAGQDYDSEYDCDDPDLVYVEDGGQEDGGDDDCAEGDEPEEKFEIDYDDADDSDGTEKLVEEEYRNFGNHNKERAALASSHKDDTNNDNSTNSELASRLMHKLNLDTNLVNPQVFQRLHSGHSSSMNGSSRNTPLSGLSKSNSVVVSDEEESNYFCPCSDDELKTPLGTRSPSITPESASKITNN